MLSTTQFLYSTLTISHLIYLHFTPVTASYKEDASNQFLRQTDHPLPGNLDSKSQGALFDAFSYTATTDESKLRLALLVDDKIDKNKDGSVQLDELVNWIKECQDRYAMHDVDRHWASFDGLLDVQNTLQWEKYADKEYEHFVSLSKHSDDSEQIRKIRQSHDNLMQKDLRRWRAADLNQDNKMSKEEFKLFLYPEYSERMHSLLVDEKFEIIDKSRDGRISIDEYLSDLSAEGVHIDMKKQNDYWLEKQKLRFNRDMDLNNDGYLEKSELSAWISKSELNENSVAEAQNLMQSADVNRDHRLSIEEILLAYHEFVNSHATDFGEALRSHKVRVHDEL